MDWLLTRPVYVPFSGTVSSSTVHGNAMELKRTVIMSGQRFASSYVTLQHQS